MYTFPDEPRVRLWDVPGAGTAAVPSGTYIQNMGLRYFDKVIIVTAGRFTTTEVELKAELEQHKVPFFMVRTKVDIDVWNNMEDNGMDERATLNLIKEDLQNKHGVENPYLVSSRDDKAFDMPRLLNDLFPGMKRQLDPLATPFFPSGGSWGEAWVVPTIFSEVLAALQGRWRDMYGAVYLIQGSSAHVSLKNGQATVVPLVERGGQVWWCNAWFTSEDHVQIARRTGELRWPHSENFQQPLVWWWFD